MAHQEILFLGRDQSENLAFGTGSMLITDKRRTRRHEYMGTAFCNRILVRCMDLDMGTNGKGSTRDYTLANRYAEFID